jgi:ABC-type amino acid transport system permease subunit
VKDLMGAAKVFAETTYKFIGTYAVLALVYIALGYGFIWIFKIIENKVKFLED